MPCRSYSCLEMSASIWEACLTACPATQVSFFFSSRRRHTRSKRDWSSDVCSSDLPLNLVGIVTPEARVPAIAGNRVLFRDGVAIAALDGGELRRLAQSDLEDDTRSEERRVGKECRYRWAPDHERERRRDEPAKEHT